MKVLNFFKVSPDKPLLSDEAEVKRRYTRARWSVFLAATLGYSSFYVCRLSVNVVKKPIVDTGVLTEGQLGAIGSALFVGYAIGKFVNGFLADRSNIRRFMSVGILCSALINLLLGFYNGFLFFAVLWAVNGWVQSMGAAPSVVGLSRWFSDRERGTYYGLWSSSHNIGEALTFILTAWIVSVAGWQWGFRGAGIIGLCGFALIALCMRDTPGSMGLPPVAQYKGENMRKENMAKPDPKAVSKAQRDTLRNPAIWMLALSSAFMYISRYAVNSWGIFYLQVNKDYSTIEASSIISVSSVCGIVGTVTCGWLSDHFFHGRRNLPAFIYGLMNCVALALFLFGPRGMVVDIVSMVLFGLSIGALLCYLGGLMAVDIAPKIASGAALGIVGVSSYVGAAVEDFVSGMTIEQTKTVVDGVARYDFSIVSWFWMASAILSVLCALAVWRVKTVK